MTAFEFPAEPFTTATARGWGLSARALELAVASGELRRVLRGVYVRSDVPDDIETRARSAALVISAHSVLRDRAAAWIHGVDVFGWAELEILPPLETCVLRWRAPTRRTGVDGRTRDLRPSDVMEIGGLKVTTPLRTALDLGCILWRKDALAALDMFMRIHGITRRQLRRALPRYRRRRGVVQLRELVAIADPRAESPGESWTRLAIIDAGLPAPTPQHWVEVDGVPTYRLDLAYPHLKVVVEYDGDEFHHRTEEQRKRDRDRRAWLRDHGWTVIVVEKDGFTDPVLGRWLRTLRSSLAPRYRPTRW